jgi:methionine biosynthesis protein MetW
MIPAPDSATVAFGGSPAMGAGGGQDEARRRDVRVDLRHIAQMVEPGARVLDVGCGDGALLDVLTHEKNVDGRGIELSMDGVHRCVSCGLSVIQGDAESDLKDYPAQAFDYVILSQTLQAMHDPRGVLENLARIGRRAIVSFPNFGYWRIRLQLLVHGRMPVTERLGYQWWETPNIHFCTIADFVYLCQTLGITIERCVILDRADRVIGRNVGAFTNLLGEQGVFLLSRR